MIGVVRGRWALGLATLALAACTGCVSVSALAVSVKNETGENRAVYLYTFTAPIEASPRLIDTAEVVGASSNERLLKLWGPPGGYPKTMAFDRGGHLTEEWTHPLPNRDDYLGGFEIRVKK